jgi:hypothetical protein
METGTNLCITSSHPPAYFKSSRHYLYYLIQCKCHENSCHTVWFTNNDKKEKPVHVQYTVFLLKSLGVQLVESIDVEVTDMEGQQYMSLNLKS